jgi:hypothetical protein
MERFSSRHRGDNRRMNLLPLPLWEREGAHRFSDGKGEGDMRSVASLIPLTLPSLRSSSIG